MAKLRFTPLFNIADLEFVGPMPAEIRVSDEIVQALSWLTGFTGHDRRLLRCDNHGALLIAPGWSNLNSVENDELYPQSAAPDTFTATLANKGVLIATSTQLVKVSLYRAAGISADVLYLPANYLYWFPNPVKIVIAATVPDPDGTASYVGITTYA